MSKNSGVRTIKVPLRRIGSTLPALALIGSGLLISASASPAADVRITPTSSRSPAVTVPDVALTVPGSAQMMSDPEPGRPPRSSTTPPAVPPPLVSMLPPGTVPGSSSLVVLDSTGIPVRALEAYRHSASLVGSADPGCHIDWALLAAIGRVESNHARFGGNQLDTSGVAQPGIIGIPLDGSNGTARILDTDQGLLDRDTTFDRAVGPMQFIPGTWRAAGVDGNGDGVKNPQNMSDAAASTAVYLCSGPGDLTRPADLRSAILRYNPSDSYVRMVTSIASAYRLGVTALPASDLAPASPAPVAAHVSHAATTSAKTTSAAGKPGSVQATKTGQQPKTAPQARASIPAAPAPALSPPAQPKPSQTTPTATGSTPSTTPATPLPTCVPDPASTTSPSSDPSNTTSPTSTPTSTASPAPAPTCVPPPCAPDPANSTSPTSTATSTASPTSLPLCVPPTCVPTTSTALPTPAAPLCVKP